MNHCEGETNILLLASYMASKSCPVSLSYLETYILEVAQRKWKCHYKLCCLSQRMVESLIPIEENIGILTSDTNNPK